MKLTCNVLILFFDVHENRICAGYANGRNAAIEKYLLQTGQMNWNTS